MEPTDIELMLRVRDGDVGAFQELLRRYREPLRRFFAALLADPSQADDIVQEVFLRLWLSGHRYEPTGRFSTYLFQIGKHYWLNQRKKLRREVGQEGLDQGLRTWPIGIEQPETELLRHDRNMRIRRAIAALPERYRVVFEMSHVEELKYAEISQRLGIPVGTVKSRMAEAVRRLRLALSDEGASDVHIVPGSDPARTITYLRINGQLHEVERHAPELHIPIVDRWRVMSDCSLKEGKVPQEGRIGVQYQDRNYDVRVTIIPTILGRRVTAHILPESNLHADLGNLGLSPQQLESVRRLIRRPSGLVAVAGPVGSGKTTFLYSMLLEIHAREPHINLMTVDDPVEFVLRRDLISQTSVERHTGLTLATALRGVLRSDPDAVLVGDLPDRETAELALRTAMTGRRVLSSLVANSALGGIQRLKEMGVDASSIAQATAGVVSQRLVRKPCPECAAEYAPPPADLQRLGLSPADGPFRRGVGCPACRQTGYSGRVALSEVLEVEDALRRRIVQDASMESLWQETLGGDGGSLWDDARAKVREGLTTVEEVTRALFDYPFPAVAAI